MGNTTENIYIDLQCNLGEGLADADPGDKVIWRNRTDNCEIALIPPSCVSPKMASIISPGGETTINYTVNSGSKGEFFYFFYCACEETRVQPYSLRTGVINVN